MKKANYTQLKDKEKKILIPKDDADKNNKKPKDDRIGG